MKNSPYEITEADIAYCNFEELLEYRKTLSGEIGRCKCRGCQKIYPILMTKQSLITQRLMFEFNDGNRIFI